MPSTVYRSSLMAQKAFKWSGKSFLLTGKPFEMIAVRSKHSLSFAPASFILAQVIALNCGLLQRTDIVVFLVKSSTSESSVGAGSATWDRLLQMLLYSTDSVCALDLIYLKTNLLHSLAF